MKEIFITEWIYKKANNKNSDIFALRIPQQINETNDFKAGNYLVKIYELKTEFK